jgi:GH35 family endo-1,4-beta-xylanase
MNVKKLLFVIIFFGLSACGGADSEEMTIHMTENKVETLAACSTCTPSRIGSHAIVFTGMSAETKDYLSSAAAAANAGMIRMDFTWAFTQPTAERKYNWRSVDESVQAAKKNNLEVLALIAETPTWASSNPTDPSARSFPPAPDYWDDWEAFIAAFVNRYGINGTNEIRHWEIWGEANDTGQWLGTPSEYAQLYSRAYNVIKRLDPGAQVLMAGMNEWNQPNWINQVLNDPIYPAKNKIDIIDVHIRGNYTRVMNLTNGWKRFFQSQGMADKPIWITEFGFPSSPTFQAQWNSPFFTGVDEADGEQKQANFYHFMIPWLLGEGEIDRVFVTLRDLDTPDTPWASEGIITQEGRPKTAFKAIQTLSDIFRRKSEN